jgi:hypothetical protein
VSLEKQQVITAKETYRAHIRIDNLHKVIKKLKKEIGWDEARHVTKLMDDKSLELTQLIKDKNE